MSNSTRWSALLWVLLFVSVVARFYHFGIPIVDHQSWRQADSAAMSRNFYQEEFNPLYPRVDGRGWTSGHVESEFPLYSFLVATLYKMFGFHESLGRLVTVLFSLASVYLVFLIGKGLFGHKKGFYSAVIFSLLPSSIYFGRAFMPDCAALFFSLLGIHFLLNWNRRETLTPLLLSGLSFAVSFAMKISFAHLLILAAGVFWLKYRWSFLTRFHFWGFLLVALLPAGLWYYHARQLYFETWLSFDIWNFSSGRWGSLATWTNPSFYWNLLVMKLGQKHLTWAGLILFWLAVLRHFKVNESSRLLYFWLFSELAFFLVVAKGNWVHDFYQLPFVPLGALFLGSLLGETVSDSLNKKLKIVIISLFILILPFSAAGTKRLFKLPSEKDNLLELAESVKKLTPRQSRLVTLQTLPDATLLYLCDRKGWQLTVGATPVQKLPELSGPEPVYIAGWKRDFEESSARDRLAEYIQTFEIIIDNPQFFILKFPENR